VVHECRFEDFAGGGGFDLCLFSESFQYIPLDQGLPRALSLLAPGGTVIIADCFRSDAYRGRRVDGPKPGGGHRLRAFRDCLAGWPVTVTHEEEITEAVAPSIDLEQGLFNVLGLGLAGVEAELAAKRPLARWTLAMLARAALSSRRRANLAERLTGTGRNAAAFCTYNHYMIFRLVLRPLPRG
jgi:MPBQ/MSBQ methyltransferase